MFERLKKAVSLARIQLRWEKENPSVQREQEERQFLPAILETLDTPPSHFSRITAGIICLVFVVALLWSWFSFIDTEAVAEGQLVPMGKVKVIQSMMLARINAIHVANGQHVEQGQLLVALNPTETETDVKQTRENLINAEMTIGRVSLLLDYLYPKGVGVTPSLNIKQWFEHHSLFGEPDPEQWQLQQTLLEQEALLYTSTNAVFMDRLTQHRASIAAVQAEIKRLSLLNPVHTEHEKLVRGLLDKGHVSRIEWIAAREKQVDTSQRLLLEKEKYREAKAALITTGSEQQKFRSEFRQQRLDALAEASQKASELRLTIIKAEERDKNSYIHAPVSGTIHQLQLDTVGGVVEAAQKLMIVVPDNALLEVEARVLNRDIGFIRHGMPVDIKVETFPYTFYGSLSGTVTHISKDAIEDKVSGMIYLMNVRLDQQKVRVDGHMQALEVGMAVTAEVKTGNRRLLEFFLEPFFRYRDETLKER